MSSLCLLFVLLFASLGGAGAQNLISDGDFDALPAGLGWPGAPLVSGAWTFKNHGGVQTNGTAGFFGNPGNFVRLESNGSSISDPTASQTVAGLVVGSTYLLSWDVAVRIPLTSTSAGPSFGVFLDSQTLSSALYLSGSLSGGGAYVGGSIPFVATSSVHTIIFAGELDSRSNGGSTTDNSYNLDNVALTLYAGTGQANSSAARLEINGLGTGSVAGPFAVHVSGSGVLSVRWRGPANAPIGLATAPLSPVSTSFGCSGLLDIGTAPLFGDLSFIYAPGLLSLNSAGELDQQFTLPALSPGSLGGFQGYALQPAGAACTLVLTAAFEIIAF